MATSAAGGSQASYHYEELATVAKTTTAPQRLGRESAHLPEASRPVPTESQPAARDHRGLPMRVVASHGDFVKPALKSPNWLILDDPAFRHQVDVELETYDEALLRHLPSRYTDVLHRSTGVPATRPKPSIDSESDNPGPGNIPDLACGPGDECPRRPQKAGQRACALGLLLGPSR